MIDLTNLITKEDKFEKAKQAKLAEIDKARDEALLQGFECDGVIYDSDHKSIQRISAIATLALMDQGFTTPYITKDNSTVMLDADAIAQLGQAAAEHEATLIFQARELKDQVLAATTQEQLDAIVWPT